MLVSITRIQVHHVKNQIKAYYLLAENWELRARGYVLL